MSVYTLYTAIVNVGLQCDYKGDEWRTFERHFTQSCRLRRHGLSQCITSSPMYACNAVRPRPHQQQCRSNIVECYNSNDSFDKVECWFERVFRNGLNKLNIFNLFRLCRKNRSTCSIRQRCFESVAGEDWALVDRHFTPTTLSLFNAQLMTCRWLWFTYLFFFLIVDEMNVARCAPCCFTRSR